VQAECNVSGGNMTEHMSPKLFSGKSKFSMALAVLIAAANSLNVATIAAPATAKTAKDLKWEQLQHDGSAAIDANKYWIAEPLLKQAVTQAGSFGLSDIRLAKSLGELGRLYTIRGLFDQAEPFLEEELHVTEQAIGKEDGQTIPAMGSLARFYLNHGTADKAQPLTEEMLSFVEGKLREPLGQTSGKLTIKKGQPLEGWAGEAAPVMRDPVIEWAITCDAVGDAFKAKGNFELADRLYKAALDVKATVLGKQHLSLANSYDNLGMLCLAKDEDTEAESYLRDALATSERILPKQSPEVYARLDKLAKCLIKAGKYTEAEDLYIRAQSFWKDEPAKTGDDYHALYALGSLYIKEKKYEQAEPVLKQAMEKAEQALGPWSIGLVPYLQQYAYTLYYLDRKQEMDQLRTRASTISGTM
jgi:tetratricopeptide (TPR) repeat protein